MIKVKDKDLSSKIILYSQVILLGLKLRIKSLEGDNNDLIGKYSNLE